MEKKSQVHKVRETVQPEGGEKKKITQFTGSQSWRNGPRSSGVEKKTKGSEQDKQRILLGGGILVERRAAILDSSRDQKREGGEERGGGRGRGLSFIPKWKLKTFFLFGLKTGLT